MTLFTVTVCQLPDDHREFASVWAALRAHQKANPAQLLILNEMPFDTWFATTPQFDQARWDLAMARHQPALEKLAEVDATVLGTAPNETRGRRFNRAFLHHPATGHIDWWRRKAWLPEEEPTFEASWYSAAPDQPDVRVVGECRVGVLTCSELWAMDWVKRLGQRGAHVIATPRATGRESLDNWLAAGRVAALVSGCFSVSSNRAGNGFGGAGWVFAPDGECLAVTSEDAPFATVSFELADAERAKRTYPRYALWTRRWLGEGA